MGECESDVWEVNREVIQGKGERLGRVDIVRHCTATAQELSGRKHGLYREEALIGLCNINCACGRDLEVVGLRHSCKTRAESGVACLNHMFTYRGAPPVTF